MHGFLNILFWRCNALPMPFFTTAFGAVAQKDLWLCTSGSAALDSRDTGIEVYKLPVGQHSKHVLMQFIPALGIIPPAEELSRWHPVLLGK